MKQRQSVKNIIALADKVAGQSGKSKRQIARDLGVSHTSVYKATDPSRRDGSSYLSLAIKLIESLSDYEVEGPSWSVKKK